MKRKTSMFIKDVLEAICKIDEYTKDLSEEVFLRNSLVQDAVLRRLEIIGEAVKNIPDDVRNKYSDVPWKQMAGMRDVLIHDYWLTVKKDLPEVKSKLKDINDTSC